MMKACRLYVVRHGQSVHNRDDIISGHVDPELTDEGKQQALAAKARLKGVHFDEIYSSDLKRAYETAAIISGKPVPRSHQLHELRERYFGALEDKPNEQLKQLMKVHQNKYGELSIEDKWTHKHVEDMESDHEVSERFIKALTKIAKQNMGKTVLVAAHGGTLRTMLIGLKHGTIADFPPGSIKNASFVELSYDGSTLSVDNSKDAIGENNG